MDSVTHGLAGCLIERWVLPEHQAAYARRRLVVAVVAANLPDADVVFRLAGPDAFVFSHRGLSHSLLVLLLLPPLLALGLRRWLGLGLGTAWGLMAACVGSHLALDVLTSWGTQLLAPFSPIRFALDWVFIVDPAMLSLLAFGVVYGRTSGRRHRDRRRGAQWGFGLLGAYLVLAASAHGAATRLIRREVMKATPAAPAGGTFPGSSYRPAPLQAGPSFQVEAVPAPLAPLLWNGLAVTKGGAAYHFSVDLLRGEAALNGALALGLDDPLAQAFFQTEAGRGYLRWARFPRVQRASPDRILLEDLRYRFKGLEAMARPGVMEVARDPGGAIRHRWVSQPLPK